MVQDAVCDQHHAIHVCIVHREYIFNLQVVEGSRCPQRKTSLQVDMLATAYCEKLKRKEVKRWHVKNIIYKNIDMTKFFRNRSDSCVDSPIVCNVHSAMEGSSPSTSFL